jgi:adenylate cyclase
VESVERRLAALLSADAVGYTRLMAQDDVATVRTITAYRGVISDCVEAHRGRVVDAPGDNLLAELPSALDATRCALAIQTELAERNAELEEDRRMHFRIGVHLGDVMGEGGRIYGDGVNIAARLEGLAEPGSVCLSGTVHEQIRGRIDAEFDDLGEREIKNLVHPIRVFRSQTRVAGGARSSSAGPPAIAVLPFDDLSAGAEHEFLADAIAADLITQLSAWRSFPVIARNSSFTYRGRAVDVKQISRELGARYLVTGSVRAAGARVRVSAELVDASTGHQIWADKFDRPLEEIFDVQDEVTRAIGTAVQPALRVAESERARRSAPESLEAWALVEHAWFELQSDISNIDVARASLAAADRALEMDSDYALAHGLRALAGSLLLPPLSTSGGGHTREEVLASTRRALALEPDDPNLWQLHGATMGNLGRTEDAVRAHRRALELDPNNAQARAALGIALIFMREPEEGLATLDQAIALSPRDPLLYNWLAYRALANRVFNRLEQAAADARAATERRPTRIGCLALASALAGLDRIEEAREARREYNRLAPELSLKQLEPMVRSIALTDADGDRFVAELRKAGFDD